MRRASILLSLVALAACGRDPAPGSVTTSETKALDDAAQMIDSRRLPDDALRPSAVLPSAPPTQTPGATAK
jgi:hypothetical protein